LPKLLDVDYNSDIRPQVFDYGSVEFVEDSHERFFPCVNCGWDNTSRCFGQGIVLHNTTPELFKVSLQKAKGLSRDIVFFKSWNEWGEGNYLEPDMRYGKVYLEVVRDI
jgi:hypothetical protein